MNGVSKKLCICAGSIVLVSKLAEADPNPNKLKYCIIITVLAIGYMIKQAILDYKNK